MIEDLSGEDLSYLAGIIDGEGCVSLHGRRRPDLGYCTPALQITNCDRRLTDWLCEQLGGSVYVRDDGRENRRPAFHWAIFGAKAREIIRRVEPLLRLKGEQARLVLRMEPSRGRGNRRLSDSEREERISAIVEMRELNRRGAP
jgi:hypothetical protein